MSATYSPAAKSAVMEEIARIESMQEMGDYTNGLNADVLYSPEGAAFRLAKLKALLAEMDAAAALRAK